MDTGTLKMVTRVLAKCSVYVSDQGTEHLIAGVQTNIAELRTAGALPHLLDPSRQSPATPSHDDPIPQVLWPLSGDTTPPTAIGERPAKRQKIDEIVDLEVELGQLFAGAESMVIDSEFNERGHSDSCSYPGCSLAVHTCCIHCLMPLCHLHCGALDVGVRHLDISQSRCHEHLGMPTNHRGLVHSPAGSVRCPCQDCMRARDFVPCPCRLCTKLVRSHNGTAAAGTTPGNAGDAGTTPGNLLGRAVCFPSHSAFVDV